MKSIWKYTLDRSVRCVVQMPIDSRIVSVQMQHNQICLWAEVNPAFALVDRVFRIVGTGRECPVGMHIGTVQENEFVWHVYEVNG